MQPGALLGLLFFMMTYVKICLGSLTRVRRLTAYATKEHTITAYPTRVHRLTAYATKERNLRIGEQRECVSSKAYITGRVILFAQLLF